MPFLSFYLFQYYEGTCLGRADVKCVSFPVAGKVHDVVNTPYLGTV